jgi:hypothetical protein
MKTKAQIIEQVIEDAIKVTVEDEAQLTMIRRTLLKLIDPKHEELRNKLQQEMLTYKVRMEQQAQGIEILKEMLKKEEEKNSEYVLPTETIKVTHNTQKQE